MIWTRTGEDIDHFSKQPPPVKKFPITRPMVNTVDFNPGSGDVAKTAVPVEKSAHLRIFRTGRQNSVPGGWPGDYLHNARPAGRLLTYPTLGTRKCCTGRRIYCTGRPLLEKFSGFSKIIFFVVKFDSFLPLRSNSPGTIIFLPAGKICP